MGINTKSQVLNSKLEVIGNSLLILLKGVCYDRVEPPIYLTFHMARVFGSAAVDRRMCGVAKKLKTKRDYSCGGIVWDSNNEQVLLIRVVNLKKQKVWTFPKGHPEGQEADEQAALREVREETGWDCEISCPLLDVHYSFIHGNIKFNKTVRWFMMNPLKEAGAFDPKEILECKWVDLDTAKTLVSYESDTKLLKRVALLT